LGGRSVQSAQRREFPEGYGASADARFARTLSAGGLRSKSWDEFARSDAPLMDFVFTVCDQAAGEVCPVWPGNPVTAHWGIPDPAAVEGSEERRRQAFRDAYQRLEARIKLFVALPIDKLGRLALKRHANQIGRSEAKQAR